MMQTGIVYLERRVIKLAYNTQSIAIATDGILTIVNTSSVDAIAPITAEVASDTITGEVS